jgi:ribonuclease Z
MHRKSLALVLLIAVAFVAWPQTSAQNSEAQAANHNTQVVMLGTGTPNLDPERSGPAVAVVVNGSAYLVDFGPGVVRRAAAAQQQKHIEALNPGNLKIAFATHLHSDHTTGLADLFLSPAVGERKVPLTLYGPPGLAAMAAHIRAAYIKDIAIRVRGLEREDPKPFTMIVHEIKPGVIYKDQNVTVTAFRVPHGSWDYAYGYRFDTADRSIVISGDTAPSDAVVKACNGCDLLVHEVYSQEWFATKPADRKKYHASFHTSTAELAGVAGGARPKMLVLYHQLFIKGQEPGPVLIKEMRTAGYLGHVVSANDLDVF